ncbi:MAG: cytochrome c oxidase subunit II, partial [Alphaproteobacteria bacterium]|nr:cytochrome c oxidase subunit II [Alphaproteobacteria bacterium]
MKKAPHFRRIFGGLAAFLTAALMSTPAFAVLGQPVPGAIGLQAAGSQMKIRQDDFFNNMLMPIAVGICIFVFILLLIIIVRFNAKANPVPSKTTHNTALEVVWTLVPVLILTVIAIPSIHLLFYLDNNPDTQLTLRATGSQWFWTYTYPQNGNVKLISTFVQDKDLKPGEPRLLTANNPAVLPINTNIEIETAATDVIHSWSVPSLGVKLDAIPGRINKTWVRIDQVGTYYGQCSQLCGQGHAYMPIEVKAVTMPEFVKWLHSEGGKTVEEIAAETSAAG